MQEKVMVLRSSAGKLLTGGRVTQLASASDVHQLNFQYMGENEVSEDYVHYVFLDPEQGVQLVLVDDYLEDIAYLSFQHVPEQAITAMQAWLSEHIGLFTLEEVRAALTADLEGNASFLTHLGLMEHRETPDAATAILLKTALNSSVTETVERALVAAQLLGWPELHNAVQALAVHSPDAHLRDFAGKVWVQLESSSILI
ncbi:hypothetical protein [Deinococcus aquatilis]|jgi:hypothetical protein|uniref:hypothetical protein n=1 Tax=Deinococcus aquatilis TaxID=519440 RepID=UPI001B7F9C36|nr:hypothetical protein [Deinococcus aquatilis]